MADPVDQLAQALERTEAFITAIEPEQAELSTPCSAWDVRALVEHVVQDIRQFAARAGAPDPGGEPAIGDDWSGAYRRAADSLLEVWREEGALDRTIQLRMGEVPARWLVGQAVADVLVHGWDLAKATEQPTDIDPDLGRFALEWGRENLRPEFRGDESSGKSFGLEVAVPDDAPVQDRLAGVFGRDPNWSPP
jgi:uncharacterized protein (TIGR03086 family)